MRFVFSLRKRTSKTVARSRVQAAPLRFRPRLEVLEDRTVPSGDLTILKVTSLGDSGKGTLRDAILRADKGPSAKSYEIDIQVPGTILLESALPDLTNTISINGLGASNTLIQRDTLAATFRILTVDAGETATLAGLAIAQGRAGSGIGGAIDNYGNLTLSDCVLHANSAASGGAIANEAGAFLSVTGGSFFDNSASNYGGAIDNNGTLTASGATFTNNTAAFSGGGILTYGVADISGCVFTGNSASGAGGSSGGGAIWNGGSLTVHGDSSFSGNTVSLYGGAIFNFATATVSAATFSENTATSGTIKNWYGANLAVNSGTSFTDNHVSNFGGAIDNNGTLTASGASFTSNLADIGGGALYSDGVASVGGCAFAGNSAGGTGFTDGGGAIRNGGSLTVQGNSTFTGNSSALYGGAIFNFGTAGVTQAKFADNSAVSGAIKNWYGASLTVGAGANFTGNQATNFGGAIDNNGTLSASSASFTNNSAGIGGGAIFTDGVAGIDGCTFSGNAVSGTGEFDGGGAIRNNGTLTVLGNSRFSGNTAAVSGGAIINFANATVNDATFASNSAAYGAAIENWVAANLTVNPGASFTGNSSSYAGGAINNNGKLNASGDSFTDNTASNWGGGISNDGTATVTDCSFSGNSAGGGGGIYNVDGALTVTSSSFSENLADGGGGIYNIHGALTATGCNFLGNSTTFGGAGISNENGTLTVTGCSFVNNSAIFELGGGIFNSGSANVTGSNFSGNSAYNGGGIYSFGALTVSNCEIRNNHANVGGGIYTAGTTLISDSEVIGNLPDDTHTPLGATLTVVNSLIGIMT